MTSIQKATKDFEKTNESLNTIYQEKVDFENKLVKAHQSNAVNVKVISDLKAANRIAEICLQERIEKINELEKEKTESTHQYQNAKIANEMLINDLKLKVNSQIT